MTRTVSKLLFTALVATCWLLPTSEASAQVSADDWFWEIDGDYESTIADTKQSNGGQPAMEIDDGGRTTWANRDYCSHWAHTTFLPYMGSQAYRVSCAATTDPSIAPRAEQHFVSGWRPGEDSARNLSFAFRLNGVPAMPTAPGGAFIAQLHDGGIPFALRWVAEPGVGYFLHAEVRYDERQPDGTFQERQPAAFYRVPLTPGTWNRMLIGIDLRRAGTGECPETSGDLTSVAVARMNNATGLWDPDVTHYGRIGTRWDHSTGLCRTTANLNHNFKIGEYVVYTSNYIDYDSVIYGKRWSNLTKNRLVGYQKSVLRLPFEETFGTTVQDRSYTYNGGPAGDPISDYNNDGTIVGGVSRILGGVNGRALRFSGTTDSYVKVPINSGVVDDFDVGNYMTVSAWFRTTSTPADNKGLVMIDEFSTSWKLLLYMRGDGIAFGVRHPGTYSRLDHVFTQGRYADNQWHLVTGTYNRFAPDGQRIKLYIDGQRVMQGVGADLPILRGDNQLVVGKYSVNGFFQGDIDDVGLFNYTMTDQQVSSLWSRRGVP